MNFRWSLLPVVWAGVLLLMSAACAQSAPLDRAIAQARAAGLAQDDYWLRLLHYQRQASGFRSQADDPRFFNARNGKTSPEAELEATVRAFFREGDDDQHPQCRFPARLHWLDQRLDLRAFGLPVKTCAEFHAWLQTLKTERVTLIFPASYLNSPSSMFGHTLLRLTPADSRRDTPLAAFALNYAADADAGDNGLVYSYKGLFGGYPGIFSIVPYYEKIKQYNDIESRDIWEYDLDLTQAEIDQLLRHAWELRRIRFDYYFLTENCSYHVLSLLDVARPGARLTDDFSVKAIPSDTVRAVVDNGMARHAAYRPATTTLIEQRLGIFRGDDSRILQLADPSAGKINALLAPLTGTVERARALELAYDYNRYRAVQASGPDPYAKRNYQLLTARSRLPAGRMWPDARRPAYQPEQGHRTARLATGGGWRDGDGFLSLRFRPAYHDVLDPLPGYTRGSQINFLDLHARYVPDDSSLQLDRFTLIDIRSLTPRDAFFKPVSWSVDTGIERVLTDNGRDSAAHLGGSTGVSYRLRQRHLAYLLLQGQLNASKAYRDNYSLGGGVSVGTLLFWRHSSAELSLGGIRYALGETDTTWSARWRQSFPVGRQSALRYRLEQRHERGRYVTEVELTMNWYL